MQLCSKPRGARGIEPETLRTRGQLFSCPPTAGPNLVDGERHVPASGRAHCCAKARPQLVRRSGTVNECTMISRRRTCMLTTRTYYCWSGFTSWLACPLCL